MAVVAEAAVAEAAKMTMAPAAAMPVVVAMAAARVGEAPTAAGAERRCERTQDA